MNDEQLDDFKKIMDEKRVSFKKDSVIQSIDFSTYNTPVFKESNFKEYILAGHDNLWPQYLTKLYNNGSIHTAIVDDKIRRIVGKGVKIEDSEDKDQLAEMTDFLKKTNIKKQLKGWAQDQQIFGYWFVGITWNKTRTAISRLYHVDATTIRVGKPDEDGRVNDFWYSEDWSRFRKSGFRPQRIERFDPLERIEENCLLMVRRKIPNSRFYSLPPYEGARDAIELSVTLTSHLLNSLQNGLNPSMIININNGKGLSTEELETTYRTIQGMFTGAKNAGKFMMAVNDSKDNATEIVPINANNMSELYSKLDEYAEGKILRIHKTSPILVGIATSGKLGGAGNTQELEVTSEEFNYSVIEPAQDEILEVLQDVLEINDFNLRVYIEGVKKISSSYDSNTLLSVCTIDEIRSKLNLPPLSESDKKNLAINASSAGAELPAEKSNAPLEQSAEEMAILTPGLPNYVDQAPTKKKETDKTE
jgi:hypothetical protein